MALMIPSRRTYGRLTADRVSARRSGASLVESCLAVFMLSMVLAGLFQVSQLFAAREVLSHAAGRGARAKTVGFNRWMVRKAVRVACIPNAGRMLVPEYEAEDPLLRDAVGTLKPGPVWDRLLEERPVAGQLPMEQARIPEYMGAETPFQASRILDYEDWDTIGYTVRGSLPGSGVADSPVLAVKTTQRYPLTVPLHRAFYAADAVDLAAEVLLENHYPLYLDDSLW